MGLLPLVLDAFAIARFHIVLIATLGALTFGWLMSGRYLVATVIAVALDWFLINLFNRITDLAEDQQNGVPGTARVARHQRALAALGLVVFVGSFAATAVGWLGPMALLPYRFLVQLMGVAYNYPLLPGRKRWKEVYAWKNLASALIFVVTCFGYPLVSIGHRSAISPLGLGLLIAYFLAFELSFEIFYDLRDLDGDRALGVPTFPVVHGASGAVRIIDALLVVAGLAIVLGIGAGALGLREALFVVAPIIQAGYVHRRLRNPRPLRASDGLFITHLGSAQLALFLVGTAAWLRAGLPPNVYLHLR